MFILMTIIVFALIPSPALAVDTLLMEEVKQITTCGENQRDVVRNSGERLALQIARLDSGMWQVAFGSLDETPQRPLTVIPSVYYPDQITEKAEFMLITESDGGSPDFDDDFPGVDDDDLPGVDDDDLPGVDDEGPVLSFFRMLSGTANIDNNGLPMDAKLKAFTIATTATTSPPFVGRLCLVRQTYRSVGIVDEPLATRPNFPDFDDADVPGFNDGFQDFNDDDFPDFDDDVLRLLQLRSSTMTLKQPREKH